LIDVIIPVYEGLEHTRRCLESLLASPPSARSNTLVVVAATPQPAIAEYLAEIKPGSPLLPRDAGARAAAFSIWPDTRSVVAVSLLQLRV